jgi:2C-methyl-D-erythritol 2,4-cyclodiphosphate synthase
MNFEEMSDAEILNIANPIMDNLMEASTDIDHERHVKDFTDRMKSIVTKEHLQKVCEKYQSENGFFSGRDPVAVFKRPNSAVVVWKQFFTKAKGEYVAEITLVYKNGKYLIDHAMVF